jgi:hypothetical protein
MLRSSLGFFLAALLPVAPAGAGDPLKTPACAEALGQLDAARQARAADVDQRRQHAARLCLGLQQPAAVPRANRWAQPPIAVPAPRFALPQPPAPQPLPPAVAIERPATATACDPNGCWTSDGTRLQRTGPNLGVPGAACSVQGAFVYCP